MTELSTSSDFTKFAEALLVAAAEMPAMLALKLHSAGDVIAGDAASKVAPYSTEIPDTIKASMAGMSVDVEAGGVLAGLYELGNKGGSSGSFNHPVFGNATISVSQSMHEFLGVSVDEHADLIDNALGETADAAIETAVKV